MYPFDNSDFIYPKNQWYIAALGSELGRDLLERRILDNVVVMYRTESGCPVILEGLCPHRLYPLAQSKLDKDSVVCSYHGFTFDETGRCTKIPGQEKIPSSFCVRQYPVIEKGPFVWVWTGDKNKADESLLPSYEDAGLGEGFYALFYGNLPMKARYQLLIENLFDLTHFNHIHGQTADAAMVDKVKLEVKEERGYLTAKRTILEEKISPFDRVLRGDVIMDGFPSPYIDSVGETRMFSPGLCVTTLRSWHGGHIDDSSHYVGAMFFIHGITPETPTSTHYFSGFSRDYCLGEDEFTKKWESLDRKVRSEDIEALEAIEKRIPLNKGLDHEISAQSDVGGLRARRLVSNLMKSEM